MLLLVTFEFSSSAVGTYLITAFLIDIPELLANIEMRRGQGLRSMIAARAPKRVPCNVNYSHTVLRPGTCPESVNI